MPHTALHLVNEPSPESPQNAVEVLIDFFDCIQFASSLFEVKMAAATALEDLLKLIP